MPEKHSPFRALHGKIYPLENAKHQKKNARAIRANWRRLSPEAKSKLLEVLSSAQPILASWRRLSPKAKSKLLESLSNDPALQPDEPPDGDPREYGHSTAVSQVSGEWLALSPEDRKECLRLQNVYGIESETIDLVRYVIERKHLHDVHKSEAIREWMQSRENEKRSFEVVKQSCNDTMKKFRDDPDSLDARYLRGLLEWTFRQIQIRKHGPDCILPGPIVPPFETLLAPVRAGRKKGQKKKNGEK